MTTQPNNSSNANTNTQATVGLGQAFGIILNALVGFVLFLPRLINSAGKAVDMVDDLLESGKSITSTMRESADDFRTTSKLNSDATYAKRLEEINAERVSVGLDAVNVGTARQVSDRAQSVIDKMTEA